MDQLQQYGVERVKDISIDRLVNWHNTGHEQVATTEATICCNDTLRTAPLEPLAKNSPTLSVSQFMTGCHETSRWFTKAENLQFEECEGNAAVNCAPEKSHLYHYNTEVSSSSLLSMSTDDKARRQLAKKLWRQRDQMRREEEKEIFQKKEQSFQASILEHMNKHSEWTKDRIRNLVRERWKNSDEQPTEWMEKLPVLRGSAFDLITKKRHQVQQRLPPGTLDQFPASEVKKRRNEQKSASKQRLIQLANERMKLLRWNCRVLEEVYKYLRSFSVERQQE